MTLQSWNHPCKNHCHCVKYTELSNPGKGFTAHLATKRALRKYVRVRRFLSDVLRIITNTVININTYTRFKKKDVTFTLKCLFS